MAGKKFDPGFDTPYELYFAHKFHELCGTFCRYLIEQM